MILTAFLIMRKFREWDPGEKDAYVKWQNRWKIRNRRLQWIGGTALLIALKEHVRDENGLVPMDKMGEAIKEIFEAQNKVKKLPSSPK